MGENDRPAYILEARNALHVMSMVIVSIPALKVADYDGFKRKSMLALHPLENFIDEAAADWKEYCTILNEGAETKKTAPEYPYTKEKLKEMVELADSDGKRRIEAGAPEIPAKEVGEGEEEEQEPVRALAWNPVLKMYL